MNSKDLKRLLKNTGVPRAKWHEICRSFNEWKQNKELPFIEGLSAGQFFADSVLTAACIMQQFHAQINWDSLYEEFCMDIDHSVGYPDSMNEKLSAEDFARYCYLCGVRDAKNY